MCATMAKVSGRPDIAALVACAEEAKEALECVQAREAKECVNHSNKRLDCFRSTLEMLREEEITGEDAQLALLRAMQDIDSAESRGRCERASGQQRRLLPR